MNVTKGNLIKTLPKWGRLYRVEANITVNKLPIAYWTNVFHFTQNGNQYAYGDRIPAIFIKSINQQNGYFYICSGVNGNKNYCKDFKFDLSTKYRLLIEQFEEGGKILFKIEVTALLINYDISSTRITTKTSMFHEVENKNAQDFNNVKVYVSNPWFSAFNHSYGLLDKLKITIPNGM